MLKLGSADRLAEAPRAVPQYFGFPRWPAGVFRMDPSARDSPGQVQEDRGRMLVRRYWVAEGHVSKVLQGVREREIGGVIRFLEAVSLRELLWRKRRQAEQIVRSILDHVDAQIVARVDSELRPAGVSKRQPFKLEQAIERGVFQSLDLGDVDQSTDCLAVENLAVRGKHAAKLEAQHLLVALRRGSIDGDLLAGRFSMQARRLKKNWYSPPLGDFIDPAAVEGNQLSLAALDIGARHERHVSSQRFAGPAQDVLLLGVAQ